MTTTNEAPWQQCLHETGPSSVRRGSRCSHLHPCHTHIIVYEKRQKKHTYKIFLLCYAEICVELHIISDIKGICQILCMDTQAKGLKQQSAEGVAMTRVCITNHTHTHTQHTYHTHTTHTHNTHTPHTHTHTTHIPHTHNTHTQHTHTPHTHTQHT